MKPILILALSVLGAVGQNETPLFKKAPAGATSCMFVANPGTQTQPGHCYETRFNRSDGTEGIYSRILFIFPKENSCVGMCSPSNTFTCLIYVNANNCPVIPYSKDACAGNTFGAIKQSGCANLTQTRSFKVDCDK